MKLIKPIFSFLYLSLLMCVAALTHADNHAPPSPAGLETWACSFNPGKDQGDLMSARDYYVRQAAKAGVELSPAFVWVPFKGGVPMDFLWMSPHESVGAFAEFSDRFAGSADLSGVQGRFDAVAACQPGLNTIMTIHTREAPEDSDDVAFISSFACDMKHGRSGADLPDLANHIKRVMSGMGDNSPNAAYMVQPITGGQNVRDVYTFSVYNNATSWSNFMGEMLPSEAGQSMIRHFGTILDCDQTLWTGMQVIGGDS